MADPVWVFPGWLISFVGDGDRGGGWGATQVRTSLVTGREELVVFGGYRNGGLAEMHPFALDLTTFCWSSAHGASSVLPAPRQRTACMRVTQDWLIMLAGGPMQVLHPRAGSRDAHTAHHTLCAPHARRAQSGHPHISLSAFLRPGGAASRGGRALGPACHSGSWDRRSHCR